MDEIFSRALLQLVKDSPEAQEALIKTVTTKPEGHSIPTGDITVSVFSEKYEPDRDKLVKAIERARELKVKDLAKILGELSAYLTIKEASGVELTPAEITLRDIDINALATFAFVKWMCSRKQTEKGSLNNDN